MPLSSRQELGDSSEGGGSLGSFAAPRLALSVVSREWAPHRGGATGRGAGGSELQQQSPGGPMPRVAQRREEEEASRLPWGTWATGLPVAAVSGVVLFR